MLLAPLDSPSCSRSMLTREYCFSLPACLPGNWLFLLFGSPELVRAPLRFHSKSKERPLDAAANKSRCTCAVASATAAFADLITLFGDSAARAVSAAARSMMIGGRLDHRFCFRFAVRSGFGGKRCGALSLLAARRSVNLNSARSFGRQLLESAEKRMCCRAAFSPITIQAPTNSSSKEFVSRRRQSHVAPLAAGLLRAQSARSLSLASDKR